MSIISFVGGRMTLQRYLFSSLISLQKAFPLLPQSMPLSCEVKDEQAVHLLRAPMSGFIYSVNYLIVLMNPIITQIYRKDMQDIFTFEPNLSSKSNPKRKRKSKQQISSLNEEHSESYNRAITQEEINELFQSRDRLQDFAQTLGSLQFTGVRRDVIEHCDKIKIGSLNYLTFETVDKIVKNRIEKMIKNKRIKRNWSEDDIMILIWIVSKYCDFKKVDQIEKQMDKPDWEYVGSLIPGVKGDHCMFKWLSLKKNNLSDNNWSEKESNLLDQIVKKHGNNDWAFISQILYYRNPISTKTYRCPKQCREHWNCYLNPNLKKGPWSKSQDLLLLNTIKKNNGLKKWAHMVTLFEGRTENALKNRFNLIIEKQMKLNGYNKGVSELQIIEHFLQRSYVDQFMTMEGTGKIHPLQGKEPKNFHDQRKKYRKFQYQKREILSLNEDTPKKSEREEESMMEDQQNVPFCVTPIQRLQLSEPEPQSICFPSLIQENQIFQEEQSHPSIQKSPQTMSEFHHHPTTIQDVKIVKLNQDNIFDLKSTLKDCKMNYLPCVLRENKISPLQFSQF